MGGSSMLWLYSVERHAVYAYQGLFNMEQASKLFRDEGEPGTSNKRNLLSRYGAQE